MRSRDCEANYDDVTFRHNFLNCHVPIGERHKRIADNPPRGRLFDLILAEEFDRLALADTTPNKEDK